MDLLYLPFVLLFGLCIGSFLNVCIYRLPVKISTAQVRSFCPKCNHPLKSLDLIPVLSFLFLKRRCRYCHEPISWRYPAIELLNMILYLLVFLQYGATLDTIIYCLASSIFIVVAMIDYDTMEINDRMHIFLLLLGLILLLIHPSSWQSQCLGALIISVPFLLISLLIKDSMGGGDIKLMAASGFLLGFSRILTSVIFASFIGSAISLYLIYFKGKSRKDMIPFGPFLVIGLILSMLYGNQIIAWYLSIL